MKSPRSIGGVLSVLVVAALAGCGYRAGGVYPEGIASVAVPVFGNATHEAGIGAELTEAVGKEIELRTPWKLVPADSADTIVSGRVVHVAERLTSRRRVGAVPEEVELHVTVDVEWEDTRSGRVLAERRGLVAVGRYVPARPAGEPREVGRHEAVARLAERIVSMMRGGW